MEEIIDGSGVRTERCKRSGRAGRWRSIGPPMAPRRQRASHGSAPERERATLRISLPASLLNQVVQFASSSSVAGPGHWGDFEQQLHQAVYRWVPANARHVRLVWDAAGQEVVVGFELGGPDDSSGGSARSGRV